jgi:hypothetical protein
VAVGAGVRVTVGAGGLVAVGVGGAEAGVSVGSPGFSPQASSNAPSRPTPAATRPLRKSLRARRFMASPPFRNAGYPPRAMNYESFHQEGERGAFSTVQ